MRGAHIGEAARGKAAIEANERRMFSALAEVEMVPLDRFATEDRVVDDCIVRFRLVGDGMVGAPLPIGARVGMRLPHVFATRDGLIARQTVLEGWKRLDCGISPARVPPAGGRGRAPRPPRGG